MGVQEDDGDGVAECVGNGHQLPVWRTSSRTASQQRGGASGKPQNAVVCACQWLDIAWVAAGNKGMLKRPLLNVLRGRQVLVLPDNDARQEWSDKLLGMQDIATFRVWKGDDDDNDDDKLRNDNGRENGNDIDGTTGSATDKSDIADRLLRIVRK